MLEQTRSQATGAHAGSPEDRPPFIPPDTDQPRRVMFAAEAYCEAHGLLDRRHTLKTELSPRADGEPVYLYRFMGPEEVVGLLQKGVRWASDTPVYEGVYSLPDQLVRGLKLARGITSSGILAMEADYVSFFRSVGLRSPQALSDAAFARDTERLRALLKAEFSPYERACMQKAPYLSGVNGFFSTAVIPSDSSYCIGGNYCYVELAVPASRMMPPNLKEYYRPNQSFHDGEVEVGLEYFTLGEVTKFYFGQDEMLDDQELRKRLGVSDDGDVRSTQCPFSQLRFDCAFLDHIPAVIRDDPARWYSGGGFTEVIRSRLSGSHLE